MARVAAGWAAFSDPGTLQRASTQPLLAAEYSRAWSYYRNHSDGVYTAAYVSSRELYTYTRLLFNPVPPVVAFYEDHLFPSAPLLTDAGSLLATPLADETDERIAEAIAQLDQWSNWLSEQLRMVRFCAATGDVLVENIDEEEREFISHRIVWPGWGHGIKQ